MNKARRKWLSTIVESLENAKYEIESVRDEEQDCFDNLPEGIQYSERGDEMEENISTMEDALSNIDDAIEYINDVLDK